MSLLSYSSFQKFPAETALSIIFATTPRTNPPPSRTITSDELSSLLSPFDMKRLESYSDSMVDYHVILDLVPTIAQLFFARRLDPEECKLSAVQQVILLALGLQRKPVEAMEAELGMGPTQTLANFGKILKRITKYLQDVQKEGLSRELPAEQPGLKQNGVALKPIQQTVEEELRAAPRQPAEEDLDDDTRAARRVQRELLDSMDMSQFAIDGAADFSAAQNQVEALARAEAEGTAGLSSTVSIRSAEGAASGTDMAKKGKKEKRRESEGGDNKRKKVKA